jgi:hypothetical protein
LATINQQAIAIGQALEFMRSRHPSAKGAKMTTYGEHRGPMNATRRDEVLRYGLPTGTHPDYEIDHLIPLCLGGSDALPIRGRGRAELSKILGTGPRRYVMKLIRSRL